MQSDTHWDIMPLTYGRARLLMCSNTGVDDTW